MDPRAELLERVNIHVFGACVPHRDSAGDCYLPIHRSYRGSLVSRDEVPQIDAMMQSCIAGGRPRRLSNGASPGGDALVYDKDIVTCWRLPSVGIAQEIYFWERAFATALGHETLWIAAEAFLEAQEIGSQNCQIEEFGNFMAGLGTQPVTIPISNLVDDLVEIYRSDSRSRFSCDSDAGSGVEDFVCNFIFSRECFFYPKHRAPVVEVTFMQCDLIHEEGKLDVQISFTWAQPLVEFKNLRNVVTEGERFILEPTMHSHQHYDTLSPCNAKYYVGPATDWLEWDATSQCFHGIVGHDLAEHYGAGRLDSYTFVLDLMAVVTKHFVGGASLDTTIRCALPVTVRRRPNHCAMDEEHVTSPPLPKGCDAGTRPLSLLRRAKSTRTLRYNPICASPASPNSDDAAHLAVGECICHKCHLKPDKEGRTLAMNDEELSRCLERKAESRGAVTPPPFELNSLNLPRLYNVAAPVCPTRFGLSARMETIARSPPPHSWRDADGVTERLPSFQSDL